MKPELIEEIIKRHVRIVVDSEMCPMIVGCKSASIEIVYLLNSFKEADELIKTSNSTEQKY